MTDSYFLVDKFCLQATNLPPPDVTRLKYLDLLHQLMVNSNWARSGRYRRGDICQMMEGLLNMDPETTEMRSDAIELVEKIFCELIDVLE